MRESRFIEQNKKKWYEFEQILRQKQKEPEKISKLFVQITEDLSYARTFYPNRSVRVYLNKLAQQVFVNLYRMRAQRKNKFWLFWSDELPYILYNSRRAILISFLFFAFSMLIGIMGSRTDPSFARNILGDRYVEMTITNIEEGDPMAVYKGHRRTEMFLAITWNNIRVAFFTFIFGVFLGLGTYAILIGNGVMLGVFQYFFYEKGYFFDSFVTIWQHGTIEISSIIIAGAAGITLGRGLLYPGTYSRIQSFQIAGMRAVKIFLSTLPLFIIAGFIEGFITRITDAPLLLRLSVILVSLCFILFFYIWLPWHKHRKGYQQSYNDDEVPPSKPFTLYYGIIGNAVLVKKSFSFLKEHIQAFFKIALAFAIILTGYYYFFNKDIFYTNMVPSFELVFFMPFVYITDLYQIIDYRETPFLLIINTVGFSMIIHLSLKIFVSKLHNQKVRQPFYNFIQAVIITFIAQLPFLLPPLLSIVVSIIIAPLLFLYLSSLYMYKGVMHEATDAFKTYLTGNYFKLLFTALVCMLIAVVMMFVFATPFTYIYVSIVTNFLVDSTTTFYDTYMIYMLLTGSFGMFLLFPFYVMGALLKTLSAREYSTAEMLKQRISHIGKQRRAYGLTRED